VNGWDAVYKAMILASFAYSSLVSMKLIHIEGIQNVNSSDIRFAFGLGII
jgi:homoserine dehydrogenase